MNSLASRLTCWITLSRGFIRDTAINTGLMSAAICAPFKMEQTMVQKWKRQPLTRQTVIAVNERELEIMRTLIRHEDTCDRYGWKRKAKPLDLGGSNGSHHSATLKAMARKGWVEDIGYFCHSRRVCIYRSTEAGRAAVSETGNL